MSYCPSCKTDVIFIKNTEYENSKLLLIFTTFSILWILLVRLILFISNSLKRKKLSVDLKKELSEENFCFLNIYFPKTIRISCTYCGYEFYNNYSKNDVKIISLVFVIIVFIVTVITYYMMKI
jgi:hypothetical protein